MGIHGNFKIACHILTKIKYSFTLWCDNNFFYIQTLLLFDIFTLLRYE